MDLQKLVEHLKNITSLVPTFSIFSKVQLEDHVSISAQVQINNYYFKMIYFLIVQVMEELVVQFTLLTKEIIL
jgi:hypothetical protein